MQRKPVNVFGLAMITGLLVWAFTHYGPVMIRGELQWIPVVIGFMACVMGFRLLSECLLGMAHGLEWFASHTPTGRAGMAHWGRYREYKNELSAYDVGPFWGLSADKAKKLFIDFVSNAVIIGPSGSGKGHTVVVNLIFLIPFSKVIMDFKPELLAICKKGLEKLGQTVIALDPFGVHKDRTGETHQINFLDVITDNLFREGGLKNVFTDAGEFAFQLYPDAPNQQGDSKYWNNGSRKILTLSTVAECLMNGYDGTMENVALLLDDQDRLKLRLCSIVGEGYDGQPDPQGPYLFEMTEWAEHHSEDDLHRFLTSFRTKAAGLLSQMRESEKQFASFLEGAQQAIAPYGFGELSFAMGPTSFDVNAIKDGKHIVNLFIVGDASRQKKTEKFFGDAQWFIQTKLKRHPKKDVPVYFINDEISQYSIFGYTSLLSWCRGFSIRTINILQNLPAFSDRHGKHAEDVLLSESEIKLFLPGQRCPKTKEKIINMLGEQSVMTANLSAGQHGEAMRESMSETGRKLMTEDELTRTPHGILLVRDQLPILQQPVSYSEIAPLRELADINPFHPKPFLNKVKLKLRLPNL